MLSFSFLFLLALYTLVTFVFRVVLFSSSSDLKEEIMHNVGFSSGSDLKEEIIHDVDTALPKLDEWKARILRAAHQDSARRDIIDNLST